MIGTLKTLFVGSSARAEEKLRDTYAVELIDQKIREAGEALKAAKTALASLMQRERAETRQVETLQARISDLMSRASEALEGGRSDLAEQAAAAIADMENELALRQTTIKRLEVRILNLRQSVAKAHRRHLDLKQGAIAARAVRKEQAIQRRVGGNLSGATAFEEAEALIARVMDADDPFEQGQILQEIDNGLNHSDAAGQLADAGFGTQTKSTASDVLRRLKSDT